MTRLAPLFVTLALGTLPLACGGSTRQDASAGGSAGAGGSGAAAGSGGFGATAGSGGGGAGGSGATAGAGGSGATVSCADYDDESSPGNVTLRIKNEGSTPIYLGGDSSCSPAPLFDLEGPQGPVQMNAGGCGNTCQALQQHGDWCTDACLVPPVVVIDPGGSYDTTWSGTTFESEKMPKECYFEPQLAPTTCDRRVIAQGGSYGALVTAATALVCNDVSMCSCTPSAQGSCEIPYGGVLSGTTLAAKTSFEMPGASLVVITFQ